MLLSLIVSPTLDTRPVGPIYSDPMSVITIHHFLMGESRCQVVSHPADL